MPLRRSNLPAYVMTPVTPLVVIQATLFASATSAGTIARGDGAAHFAVTLL